MALFSFFLLSTFETVRGTKDRLGSNLAAGVFTYFFWQIFINAGMVMGIIPVVGIPLPFISHGGSTTVVNFSLTGLVLNTSIHRLLSKT